MVVAFTEGENRVKFKSLTPNFSMARNKVKFYEKYTSFFHPKNRKNERFNLYISMPQAGAEPQLHRWVQLNPTKLGSYVRIGWYFVGLKP